MIFLEEVQKLRELAIAATPGPWSATTAGGSRRLAVCTELRGVGLYQVQDLIASASIVYVGTPPSPSGVAAEDSILQGEANAAFIAAANPDAVLALLREIDRLNMVLRSL